MKCVMYVRASFLYWFLCKYKDDNDDDILHISEQDELT